MIRYYCSGFDKNNAFGHGIGTMLKKELNCTNSIVYIPSGSNKIEKSKAKIIPIFTNYFKNIGIEFKKINLITPDLTIKQAKDLIKNADMIILMGGDPFKQKELCQKLNIKSDLKEYNGIMLGYSAGAMLMSKYIIVTPCSEEYPDFHIEEGLDLDGISIYPHNNTSNNVYPKELINGNEIYKRDDLLKVAKKYGYFYLLQDYEREDGLFDISIIKSTNGKLEYYRENEGKIWKVTDKVRLED